MLSVSEGDSVNFVSGNVKKQKTKPPKPYSESELLKDLTRIAKYCDENIQKILKEKDKDKKGENGGIGTPATRSSILKGLIERGLLVIERKKIRSTQKGRELIATLPAFASKPDMTALWHAEQQKIAAGDIGPEDFLENVCRQISDEIYSIAA